MYRAIFARHQQLTKDAEAACLLLRDAICPYRLPDGSAMTDTDFVGRIREQLPPNTYLTIQVNTISNFHFVNGLKKARKIELVRSEWGISYPFEGVGAFFRAIFEKKSIYRKSFDTDTIMAGILASSVIQNNPNLKTEFEAQICAAYWSGKSIEIIIPFDYSGTGVVKFTSTAKIL